MQYLLLFLTYGKRYCIKQPLSYGFTLGYTSDLAHCFDADYPFNCLDVACVCSTIHIVKELMSRAPSQLRYSLSRYGISIIDIRRLWERKVYLYNIINILVRQHLILSGAPGGYPWAYRFDSLVVQTATAHHLWLKHRYSSQSVKPWIIHTRI